MRDMPIRRGLHRAAHAAERRLERRRRPPDGPAAIVPHRGFGRDDEMIVRGRVLVEKRITRVTENEPVWRNVVNTYRRFRSDELPGVRVRASFRDVAGEGLTDEEGHFEIRLDSGAADRERLWHEVALELPDSGATALSHVLIPPRHAEFAIISDIDDTIVQTGATSLLRMARSVMSNAAARLPFEGVADLYRVLHRGINPIFYVSSGPWNLYDLLHDFMNINGIPYGPMFLQDWGVDAGKLIVAAHDDHKLEQIQRIVDYYPRMRFVLIGDSGQRDPEIYLRVIQTHRDRVVAAFIRDVTPDLRDRAVARILEESNAAGVEMLFVRDSGEALRHAARLGLVSSLER